MARHIVVGYGSLSAGGVKHAHEECLRQFQKLFGTHGPYKLESVTAVPGYDGQTAAIVVTMIGSDGGYPHGDIWHPPGFTTPPAAGRR